jgi:hypothetical protein
MNTPQTTTAKHDDTERISRARESFSGRLLTDAQFGEALSIARIIHREIRKSGSFKDKLGDYANAFARTERFDATKANTIIRDLFRERYGQSMNQMREELSARDKKIGDELRAAAYQSACAIGERIETGDKISFFRAITTEAQSLGAEFGITDAAARRLMAEEFKAVEGTDLDKWGKELEERFYRPQIEAEKAEREQARTMGNRSAVQSNQQHRNQSAGWQDDGSKSLARGFV